MSEDSRQLIKEGLEIITEVSRKTKEGFRLGILMFSATTEGIITKNKEKPVLVNSEMLL